MAEKFHSQQPAQLKGCFYFSLSNSSLFFAQPEKVEPSYQSYFSPSEKQTLHAIKESLPPVIARKKETKLFFSNTYENKYIGTFHVLFFLIYKSFRTFTYFRQFRQFRQFSFFLIRHNARRTKRALAHNCCHTAIGG